MDTTRETLLATCATWDGCGLNGAAEVVRELLAERDDLRDDLAYEKKLSSAISRDCNACANARNEAAAERDTLKVQLANEQTAYKMLSEQWNETDLRCDTLKALAARYEYVRTLNPRSFQDLWTRCMNEDIKFDDAVDAEIARLTRARSILS